VTLDDDSLLCQDSITVVMIACPSIVPFIVVELTCMAYLEVADLEAQM
jgi:hypothetical protein